MGVVSEGRQIALQSMTFIARWCTHSAESTRPGMNHSHPPYYCDMRNGDDNSVTLLAASSVTVHDLGVVLVCEAGF